MKAKITAGLITGVLLVILIITQAKTFKSNPPAPVEEVEAVEDTVDLGVRIKEDPWPELEKLVKTYDQRGGIAYRGTMKLIDGESESEKILEELKFEYIVFGNQSYYKMGDMEGVIKEDILLVADHQNKSIALGRGSPTLGTKNLFKIADFKKILEQSSAQIYLSQRGAEKVVTIDSISDPDIQGYRIYYNPNTYIISRILVGMTRPYSLSDEPVSAEEAEQDDALETDTSATIIPIRFYTYYLDLSFANTEKRNYDKNNFNPENRFVQWTGREYALQPAFKTYVLLGTGSEIEQKQEDQSTIEE